jgi:hypothetical protein
LQKHREKKSKENVVVEEHSLVLIKEKQPKDPEVTWTRKPFLAPTRESWTCLELHFHPHPPRAALTLLPREQGERLASYAYAHLVRWSQLGSLLHAIWGPPAQPLSSRPPPTSHPLGLITTRSASLLTLLALPTTAFSTVMAKRKSRPRSCLLRPNPASTKGLTEKKTALETESGT